jgi:hypothetical protein
MFVIVDIQTIFNTEFVGIFIVYLNNASVAVTIIHVNEFVANVM